MDIRLLERSEIAQAKMLWKEAFSDSDEFIDWYFNNKVLPGNSLGIFERSLVSVLHMIPLTIIVQGRQHRSAFIAGAATAKHRQGEGLMRALLFESLKLMKTRGILMTHLNPFKHSFYEKYGWATYTYVHNKRVTDAQWQWGEKVIETTDFRVLSQIYSKMMLRFDGYVQRGSREWLWRLGELASDKGKASVLMKNANPAAYMLYFGNEGKADIIEAVYSDENDKEALLAYILKTGFSEAKYFIPALNGEDASPYGMARVVDAKAILNSFGAECILDKVRIVDDFAEWNNVGQGIEIGIGELAKTIHMGANLCNIGDKKTINQCNNKLMNVFSHKNTCIFESY